MQTSSSRRRQPPLHLKPRNGKRTGLAAVRIAVEMVEERLINEEAAIQRIRRIRWPICSRRFLIANPCRGAENRQRLPAGPGALRATSFSARRKPSGARARRESFAHARRNFAGRFARHDRARAFSLRGRRFLACGAGRRQMGKVWRLRRGRSPDRLPGRTLSASGVTLKEGDYLSIDGRWRSLRGRSGRRRLPRSCRCWSRVRSMEKRAPSTSNTPGS